MNKIIHLGEVFKSEEERSACYLNVLRNKLPMLIKIDDLCSGKERNKVRIIIK
jgi:hypothetical protein